jgi:DNA-binding MarR family transcriptional regulator
MPPADNEPAAVADVTELNLALRSLFMQAKSRHRQMDANSDQGKLAVLFTLAKTGPIRASALAKETSLDLSTVSRHLRGLEEDGQIEKTADPDDKRAFVVGITRQGDAFVHEFMDKRTAQVHTALADWTAYDVRTLASLLARFVRDTEGFIK